MRRFLILAFVVFVLMPVAADAQRAAEPPPITHERVSVVVSADWNDDGLEDKAVLYVIHDAVDLIIYFSTGPSQPLNVHTWVKGITQRVFLEEQPALALSSDKSLELTASQFGFGRYPWENKLTIAFNDGVFLVTNYYFMTFDRLPENGRYGGSCYLSLLNGEGTGNDKAFRTEMRAVPVTEWDEQKAQTECVKYFK